MKKKNGESDEGSTRGHTSEYIKKFIVERI